MRAFYSSPITAEMPGSACKSPSREILPGKRKANSKDGRTELVAPAVTIAYVARENSELL